MLIEKDACKPDILAIIIQTKKEKSLKMAQAKKMILVLIAIYGLMLHFSIETEAATSNNWAWPTSIHTIQSDWPNYRSGKYHGGTDFPVALNSPVYATCDGEIVSIQSLTTSYGKHIKLKAVVNGNVVFIRYCHLNNFAVSVGQKVKAGQIIGYSGSTGNSTGPHLHYEVRNSSDTYGNSSTPNLRPSDYLPGTSAVFQTDNPSPTPAVNNPIGNMEVAEGGNGTIHLVGWAFDKDNSNASLEIHVYVGGLPGSNSVKAMQGFVADLPGGDVNNAYGIGGNHRFDITMNLASWIGTHMVYVYAINIGSGDHTVLWANNITVTGHNPRGYFDSVESKPGKIHVRGWAFDEDDPGKSLEVHVYIGGKAGTAGASCHPIQANIDRPDVNKAYGISGKHGFDAWINTDKAGDQDIYIHPINVGGGANVSIGNKTIKIDMESTTGQTISDGDYHIVSALDQTKGINSAGTNVQLGITDNNESQLYNVTYLGDGYYKIISKSSGYSLDVEGESSANCANVMSHTYHGNANQQWIIKEAGNGWYYIYSRCNGLMLDVWNAKTDDGTNIQMHTPTGSKAQHWKFVAWSKDSGKTIKAGDYHILTATDKTKGLDLFDYNPANKTPIGISPNATNKRQVFTVDYLGNGYYTLRNKEAETAVEIYGEYAQKGRKINSMEYNKTNAQQWIIKKSSNSPYYNIVSKCGGFSMNADTSKKDHFVDATLEVGDGSKTQDWLFIPDEDQKLTAVTKDLNAALTWNSLSWADTYDLVITDADGKDFSQKGLKDTSFMDELPVGSYSAYIRSSNEVYSLDSDKITFTTKRSAEDTVAKDITFEGQTFTYDGTTKALAITQKLPDGISVKYSGNDQTDAGTYTVTAQFTDSKGQVIDVKSAELVIYPKDVSKPGQSGQEITIEKLPEETYTGQEIVPELAIKDGSTVLKKDKDYTVVYDNNTNAGTARVKITFTGNYTGEKEVSFRIIKATNSWNKALVCEDVSYGTALHPLAEAAYGEVVYRYAAHSNGSYAHQIPSDAGTYFVKAYVEESENYTALESEPVAVRLTKATYDLSDISFEDTIFTYDGEPKSLSVKGQLPLGVEVDYEGNDVTDVGEYTVAAHFSGDANHEDIPSQIATLTIEPQKVLIPVGYNDLVYNGEEQYGIWESEQYTIISGGAATEAGQHEATVRLNDKKNFIWEDGTTADKKVTWTISNAANEWTQELSCPDITYGETPKPSAKAKYGKVEYSYSKDVYEAFSGKVPKEAGTYFVRAQVKESGEYSGLENIMEFTIKKAAYDLSDIAFNDSSVTYDGRLKNITVKGSLPEGVDVTYEGNGKVNAGTYEIRASFTGDDNHELIPDRKATLTILPKIADDLTFGTISDRVYSGRTMEPEIDVEDDYIPLTRGIDYDVDYKDNTDAGTAAAAITLKGNYEGTKEIPFTIRQAKNSWKTALSCEDIPYGEMPEPIAEARFGSVKYVYSDQEKGDYSGTIPKKYGTWYVKAMVEGTTNYTSLESEPIQFTITAHEHSWDEGKTTKQPTCTESGTRTFTCKECGDTKVEVIPATGHTVATDPAVEPTEDATGLTEGSHCSVCGEILKKQEILPVIPKKPTGGADSGHETPVDPDDGTKNTGNKDTEKQDSGKQTTGTNGQNSASGTTEKQSGSTKPATSSGAEPTAPKSTDVNHPAVEQQDKTITTQKGDGDLKGSDFHTLSACVKKSAKNSNTLAWNKVKGASGYIIYGNQCGAKFRFKKLATVKKNTWVHKKLKKGTYYKYLVVAYKSTSGSRTVLASSKTIHAATTGGKVGNCKKLTVNKNNVTIKKKKTFAIKAKEVAASKKLKIKKHRKIAFESGNPKVATVSASGKVKGVKKGRCKIYVYAQNGVCKVVNVRVK